MNVSRYWRFAILMMLPLLAACGSTGVVHPASVPSFDEFAKNPAAVEARFLHEKQLGDRYIAMVSRGGVETCSPDGTLCKAWDQGSQKVAIWFKDKETMGLNTKVLGVYSTDEYGRIPPGLQPEIAHAADQAGIGREVMTGLFGIVQTGVNGALAAKITADSCRDGACGGGATVITQVSSESSSAALNQASSNITKTRSPAPKLDLGDTL